MFSLARQKLVETVESVLGKGKVALLSFPIDGAPALPWAVYYDDPDGEGADNTNWSTGHRWTVELYELNSDSALEESLFEALQAAYGFVEPPDETWIEAEECYRCTFRFDEIEGM